MTEVCVRANEIRYFNDYLGMTLPESLVFRISFCERPPCLSIENTRQFSKTQPTYVKWYIKEENEKIYCGWEEHTSSGLCVEWRGRFDTKQTLVQATWPRRCFKSSFGFSLLRLSFKKLPVGRLHFC